MSADRTTEILNYLSAISRDVGAFRTETKAHFDRVDKRLERLETDMREVREEVRGISTRFDRLESRVLDIRANQRDLEDRVIVLEGKQK